MPRPARPCALRAYVAFYVTFEPALRYSPRKQQFKLVLLGELRHFGTKWHQEAGDGKTSCLSAFLKVTCTSSAQPFVDGRPRNRFHEHE